MKIALFPGSFDPPSFGHLNIIERARKLFDELHIVIAVNKDKKYLFTEAERLNLMKTLVSKWDNITVQTWGKLIVDYAHTNKANVIIRGIRNFSDFSYEYDLSILNKGLADDIETIFLPTDPDYFILRSSSIKELASFGGDVSKMVPPIVEKALKEKYKEIF